VYKFSMNPVTKPSPVTIYTRVFRFPNYKNLKLFTSYSNVFRNPDFNVKPIKEPHNFNDSDSMKRTFLSKN
jgi:hypothetical protein